jgi:hypothetical protein
MCKNLRVVSPDGLVGIDNLTLEIAADLQAAMELIAEIDPDLKE